MSAKKGVSFWFECSRCGTDYPKSMAYKHGMADCKMSYPCIQDGVAHVSLSKVPAGSKISTLPFIKTRHASSVIFLAEEIIKQCGFITFDWILVNTFHEGTAVRGERIEPNNPPIALRVWPIPDSNSISGNSSGAMLTDSAFFASPLLEPEGLYTLENFEPESDSDTSTISPFEKFQDWKYLKLEYVDLDQVLFYEEEEQRLFDNFFRKYKNRIVTNGNVLRIKFYTDVIAFRLACGDRPGLRSIDEAFGELDISKNVISKFHKITNETNLSLNFEHKKEYAGRVKPDLEKLEDVGGLDDVINKLSTMVKYILQNACGVAGSTIPVPPGIILYGHHGTGKSMLTRAFCNSFELNTFVFEKFGRPSRKFYGKTIVSVGQDLTRIFNDAIRHSPSVVIIENLDVIGAKASRSEVNSSFISLLRYEMEKLNSAHVPVIVLATCTDLDSVDDSLRTPCIFGTEVDLPVPSVEERLDIIKKLLQDKDYELCHEEIQKVAEITHGFVGADLKSLISQSYLNALKSETNVVDTIVKMKDVEQSIKIVHPSAMKSIHIDVPNVKWEDIGGQKDLKFKLTQAIEWPLKYPEAFKRLGITSPKGILMYGPPGCSKTMIAKAIATESGLNFISVKGSELFSKWVGESEKAVRTLFRKARQVAPCVLFFDEIDSLGGERSSSGGSSNVHERVLAQLLIEIDGIEPLKDVTIVAATNRPDIIDPALLRPGRLDRIIHVPLPDDETRKEIFGIHFRKMPISREVNIELLVDLTKGYSGAEIAAVCHEAALKALEENIDSAIIIESQFLEALKHITPRTSATQIEFYEKYAKLHQV